MLLWSYWSTTLYPTAALCGFFSALPQGGELFGPRMDCVARVALERCCAGNGGPRSPLSRPLGRALRLVGLVGEHGATLHRTDLRVLLRCPLGKARPLALPVGLSRRGRIPSAAINLVQFTLCKVVLCICFLAPFLRSKNQSSVTPKRNCLVVQESLCQ